MWYRSLVVAALGLMVVGEVAAQDVANPKPDVDLTLVGTAVDGAGGGLAIIQRGDGAVQFLEAGDEIQGYTVRRIEPSEVLLAGAEGEVVLRIAGASPLDRVAAVRANFLSTLASARESGWQSYQLGDRVMFLDEGGRPQASFSVPDELRGEEFATTPGNALR